MALVGPVAVAALALVAARALAARLAVAALSVGTGLAVGRLRRAVVLAVGRRALRRVACSVLAVLAVLVWLGAAAPGGRTGVALRRVSARRRTRARTARAGAAAARGRDGLDELRLAQLGRPGDAEVTRDLLELGKHEAVEASRSGAPDRLAALGAPVEVLAEPAEVSDSDGASVMVSLTHVPSWSGKGCIRACARTGIRRGLRHESSKTSSRTSRGPVVNAGSTRRRIRGKESDSVRGGHGGTGSKASGAPEG